MDDGRQLIEMSGYGKIRNQYRFGDLGVNLQAMQRDCNSNQEWSSEQLPPVDIFQLIRKQKVQEVICALDEDGKLSAEIDKESGLSMPMLAVREFTDENASYVVQRVMGIDAGACLRYKDNNKQTVLFVAAAHGKLECFKLILQCGLLLGDVDLLGQTCLFSAAQNNQYPIFRHLFAEKIDKKLLNHKDTLMGHTILFYAAMKGHTQLCNYLVEKGADPFITDNFKQTAKYYAYVNKHTETDKYLSSLSKKPVENTDAGVCIDLTAPKVKDNVQMYRFCKIDQCISREMKAEEIAEMFGRYREIQEMMRNPQKIPRGWLQEENQGESWRKVAMKVVGQCIDLKCAYWFVKIPEKHERGKEKMSKISHPMDLTTVKHKLEHYCYRQRKDFITDMHLIWGNCEKMPGESQLILEYAKELKTIFQKLLDENNFFDYV